MREFRDIVRMAIVAIIALVASSADVKATACDYLSEKQSASATQPTEGKEHISLHICDECLASESPQLPHTTSLAKSVQRVHSGTNHHTLNISVIRSVKSATYANRYGLCNHKILFSMYARHYYINGLRHLII